MDRVKVSDPGPISARQFGISSDVPLAGGRWVVDHSGGRTVEAVATHAAVSEQQGYRAIAQRLPWAISRTESGGFVAVDRIAGIYGIGADRNDALVDLIKSLHEHRDVLERQGALSPGLQNQLEYLRAIL